MITITKSKYNAIHKNYRGVWDSDNIHGTNHNGKRTMLHNENGATVLLIEGIGFEIIDDVDLFQTPEDLPAIVQSLLNNYSEEDNTYNTCEKLCLSLRSLGYTFEYGMDYVPFELRLMTDDEKLNHKKEMERYYSDWQEACARNNDKRSFDAWFDSKFQD